ncbi:MAG: leucine-rich repeat domain-containing protein [Candidatus Moeniiplasma glomeromycotorum]|nr:leucine-rich repeat domain-containing protein [Candidatus Moeniiplasma glomeromycotorum]MCE8167899.1 leucine-rich repeat domain-containing protein [Candidatus Moeniiplasma glomeromycotorum]MCE8169449.1 leucine-rich repeat domain-containing protein [Candidatus Moeniiplasma glomeromycotorum]
MVEYKIEEFVKYLRENPNQLEYTDYTREPPVKRKLKAAKQKLEDEWLIKLLNSEGEEREKELERWKNISFVPKMVELFDTWKSEVDKAEREREREQNKENMNHTFEDALKKLDQVDENRKNREEEIKKIKGKFNDFGNELGNIFASEIKDLKSGEEKQKKIIETAKNNKEENKDLKEKIKKMTEVKMEREKSEERLKKQSEEFLQVQKMHQIVYDILGQKSDKTGLLLRSQEVVGKLIELEKKPSKPTKDQETQTDLTGKQISNAFKILGIENKEIAEQEKGIEDLKKLLEDLKKKEGKEGTELDLSSIGNFLDKKDKEIQKIKDQKDTETTELLEKIANLEKNQKAEVKEIILTEEWKKILKVNSLEEFKNLEKINFGGQKITELPELRECGKLTHLYCENNQLLTKLPEILPINLTTLHCYNTQITKLPEILPINLTTLYCYNTQITQLPTLPNTLTTLNCSNTQITELPEIIPANLTFIQCYNRKNADIGFIGGNFGGKNIPGSGLKQGQSKLIKIDLASVKNANKLAIFCNDNRTDQTKLKIYNSSKMTAKKLHLYDANHIGGMHKGDYNPQETASWGENSYIGS